MESKIGKIYGRAGKVFIRLKRYRGALTAFDKALRLGYTGNGWIYAQKGHALRNLKRYEEALIALDEALRLGQRVDGFTQR